MSLGAGGSSGKRPMLSDENLAIAYDRDDDDGEETDASNATSGPLGPEARGGGGRWGFGDQRRSRQQDGLGDWFKLKWWRKRRRDDGQNGNQE